MFKVIVRNDFSAQEITVDASRPVSRRKLTAWRRKLHGAGCASGDDLGGRGVQADPAAYEALLLRACRVVATGRDE